MKLEQMLRKLKEKETHYEHWDPNRHMAEEVDADKYLRNKAERMYELWLRHNNPDSVMYKYPKNPNDHEKFMWIEGYMVANKRGRWRDD